MNDGYDLCYDGVPAGLDDGAVVHVGAEEMVRAVIEEERNEGCLDEVWTCSAGH